MKFIVTYTTGMYEDMTQYVVPVEAPSKIALVAALDAEIKYKAELKKRVTAAAEAMPKPSFGKREEIGVHAEHPDVQNYVRLVQQYHGSVKVHDRYFAGLDDIAIDEIEVLTLAEWIEEFNMADAMEDARRKGRLDS